MHIGICDDLASDLGLLQSHIEKYSEVNNMILKISSFINGESLIAEMKKGIEFNIVFLDIYMNESNGMETARAIRNLGINCMIIFTTTSLDYAIDSYEVQAVHYLVKPVTYEKLESALNRCKQFLNNADYYIEVKSDRLMVRVPLRELIFAEVYGNLTVLHTLSGDIRSYISLDELARLLTGKEFLRCHRSYIINMRFVSSADSGDFLLNNGQKIPIRRQDKQQMKQLYANYLFDIVRRREND